MNPARHTGPHGERQDPFLGTRTNRHQMDVVGKGTQRPDGGLDPLAHQGAHQQCNLARIRQLERRAKPSSSLWRSGIELTEIDSVVHDGLNRWCGAVGTAPFVERPAGHANQSPQRRMPGGFSLVVHGEANVGGAVDPLTLTDQFRSPLPSCLAPCVVTVLRRDHARSGQGATHAVNDIPLLLRQRLSRPASERPRQQRQRSGRGTDRMKGDRRGEVLRGAGEQRDVVCLAQPVGQLQNVPVLPATGPRVVHYQCDLHVLLASVRRYSDSSRAAAERGVETRAPSAAVPSRRLNS